MESRRLVRVDLLRLVGWNLCWKVQIVVIGVVYFDGVLVSLAGGRTMKANGDEVSILSRNSLSVI